MERVLNAEKKKMKRKLHTILFVLITVIVLAVVGVVATINTLINNARVMGQELVESYSSDEELSISKYETLVAMSMAYLNEVEASGIESDKLDAAMLHYFEKVIEASGYDNLKCYAMVYGRVITTEPDVTLKAKKYQETSWYQEALQADGKVIFTSLGAKNEPGVMDTNIVQVNPDTGNAIIFDLDEEFFDYIHQEMNLAEASAYYLYDANGKLLYYKAPFVVARENIENYALSMYQNIMSGNYSEQQNDKIVDLDGEVRGIYFNRMSNGWVNILTVPQSTLTRGLRGMATWYCLVFLIFIVVLVAAGIRDVKINKSLQDSSNTIRALCNSFFAIYRINVKEETYVRVKGSQESKQLIAAKGTYQNLLNAMAEFLDDEIGKNLIQSFSMEHVRELVRNRVTDFGGDFVRKIDGVDRWMHVSLILDDALPEEEAVLSFRIVDAEKQKQLQQAKLLENALAVADASDKSQKQFFASVSHNMRTPLNIIIGMNELASREDCTPERRRDCLKRIDFASRDLLSLVNNILEISRMEQEQSPLDKRIFDICEEMTLCVEPYREQAKMQGKEFILSLDVERKLVKGDPAKLIQIINNLLSNSLKFTNSGDTIRVCMSQKNTSGNKYTFVIEDTGIGMSENFLPRIYEPYSQENRFGVNASSGSGLGMAIVKNLVSQKSGEIEVTSTLGQGTKYVLTLPFASGDTMEQEKKVTGNQEILRHLRILLVEDNDLNREIMKELLTEQGAIVTEAVDGKEALDIFQQSKPFEIQVILMDMQMPVMNGCESAAAIRGLDRADADRVCIVALTANAFSEDIVRTAQAGMNDHLAKPVNMALLCETLERLLGE